MTRLEQKAKDRPRRDQFTTVEAVPVAHAKGRPPGLYHNGRPGSTVGILVYDPAQGPPVMPEGRMPPWGLFICCDDASFGPDYDPWV
jgi:hypothetical protein